MTATSDGPTGPFSGVVVVDLSHALSGPFCSMLLAELGARVIKIERPPVGDSARHFAPMVDGEPYFFASVNRGKEDIALDIEDADDRKILEALVKGADVVLENFRPGTLDRHGLGYERLRELNPRIILASISGYGQTGPDHWEGAYDTVIQGVSGLMSVTGEPGSGPVMTGVCVADYLTGIYTFGALGAALFGRERTGEGAQIDIAMHDAVLSIMGPGSFTYLAEGRDPEKTGNASSLAAPFDVFEAADGPLTLCAADDHSFIRLCKAIEREELADDARYSSVANRLANYDTLRPTLNDVFGSASVADWIGRLQHAGVACGPVNTVSKAFEDAQTFARNMVVNAGNLRLPGNPIKMSTLDDPSERRSAPALGADTDAIRAELGLPSRNAS
jgi:CoA:oxalate CoA-transferase